MQSQRIERGSHTRRSSVLADLIMQDIAEQALPVGSRLGTKQSMAQQYGAAVATVTEALRALEDLGRVETRTGRYGGVFVSRPKEVFGLARGNSFVVHGDASSFRELLHVIDALDPEIAREAALHCTPEHAEALRAALARLEEAWDGPAVEQQRRNWDLHRMIGRITPNRTLSMLYVGLLDQVAEKLDDRFLGDDSRASGLDVHQDLVSAIVSHDDAGAVEQCRRHRELATSEDLSAD